MVAQTESTPGPTYAKIKEWLTLASIIVVVAAAVAGGLLGGMKLVIAPLQTDIRAIHGRLDRMDGRLDRMDSHIQGLDDSTQNEFRAIHGRLDRMDSHIRGLNDSTQNEFKAVRQDTSTLSERLIRLETLLEQVIHQPDAPQ